MYNKGDKSEWLSSNIAVIVYACAITGVLKCLLFQMIGCHFTGQDYVNWLIYSLYGDRSLGSPQML